MTKRDLVKMLEPWPEHAEIEVSVNYPDEEDHFWVKIIDVEKPRTPEEIERYKIDKDDANIHCLVYTGGMTME